MPTAKTKRLLMVLFWNRATFPLASLVGALFGVAFTIVPGRTGMVRGFAAAVAMLVLFYLISHFTLVLAKTAGCRHSSPGQALILPSWRQAS